MDIYDFRSSRETPAPAALYFHAGAFLVGGREFGAGTLCWLAEQGMVGFSVSYRLTSDSDGRGVAGSISSVRHALRYVRAHAEDFGIEKSKITVIGDSAGGLMALSLVTRLQGDDEDNSLSAEELPAAVITGWGVCTLQSKSWYPIRADDGSWQETPAVDDLPLKNVFMPKGGTPAEAQEVVRKTVAGVFLAFGRRANGWLPASVVSHQPSDGAASISPLSRASTPGLPPILMLIGGSDTVVPAEQQLHFAETARAAGNRVSALVFEGGSHGVGGINSTAGREAVRRFLEAQGICLKPAQDENIDPAVHVLRSIAAFGLDKTEPTWGNYDIEELDKAGSGWLAGTATVQLAKSTNPYPISSGFQASRL
jgi:acetyl esterase/lipase